MVYGDNMLGFLNLEFLNHGSVYITCAPEVLDFTSRKRVYKLILCGPTEKAELALPDNPIKLRHVVGVLKGYLEPAMHSKGRMVLGWNIKSLFSFIKHYAGSDFVLSGRILDLKVMESYLGLPEGKTPESFVEAESRFHKLSSHKGWKRLIEYYKNVAHPLVTSTIPSLENIPLIHNEVKKPYYPCYEIEGQANGRLRCDNAFEYSYNPHTMNEENKSKFNAPTDELVKFVYLDYKHMEVSVLQWLSQDRELGKLMESGVDVYAGIWKSLTGQDCDGLCRKRCKAFFLPVIYGQGPSSLSKVLKISENNSTKLINKLNTTFPIAFQWIKQIQENIGEDGLAQDYFGRFRHFKEYQYRVRNFVVQSAGATICLHKLVKLQQQLDPKVKILYYVHDGYMVMIPKSELNKHLKSIISILEAEEEYYPNLRLKVSVKIGDSMNQLKHIDA